jgi:hypothetical protein
MRKLIITAMLAGLCATLAMADEVWSSNFGDIIYERDLDNGMAVLSYPLEDYEDQRGLIYVFGLAGQYEGRGRYDGIWIEPFEMSDPKLCEVAISNPETEDPEYKWGRVELIFANPDYPGTFVAQGADCFEDPIDVVIGYPVTGETAKPEAMSDFTAKDESATEEE